MYLNVINAIIASKTVQLSQYSDGLTLLINLKTICL